MIKDKISKQDQGGGGQMKLEQIEEIMAQNEPIEEKFDDEFFDALDCTESAQPNKETSSAGKVKDKQLKSLNKDKLFTIKESIEFKPLDEQHGNQNQMQTTRDLKSSKIINQQENEDFNRVQTQKDILLNAQKKLSSKYQQIKEIASARTDPIKKSSGDGGSSAQQHKSGGQQSNQNSFFSLKKFGDTINSKRSESQASQQSSFKGYNFSYQQAVAKSEDKLEQVNQLLNSNRGGGQQTLSNMSQRRERRFGIENAQPLIQSPMSVQEGWSMKTFKAPNNNLGSSIVSQDKVERRFASSFNNYKMQRSDNSKNHQQAINSDNHINHGQGYLSTNYNQLKIDSDNLSKGMMLQLDSQRNSNNSKRNNSGTSKRDSVCDKYRMDRRDTIKYGILTQEMQMNLQKTMQNPFDLTQQTRGVGNQRKLSIMGLDLAVTNDNKNLRLKQELNMDATTDKIVYQQNQNNKIQNILESTLKKIDRIGDVSEINTQVQETKQKDSTYNNLLNLTCGDDFRKLNQRNRDQRKFSVFVNCQDQRDLLSSTIKDLRATTNNLMISEDARRENFNRTINNLKENMHGNNINDFIQPLVIPKPRGMGQGGQTNMVQLGNMAIKRNQGHVASHELQNQELEKEEQTDDLQNMGFAVPLNPSQLQILRQFNQQKQENINQQFQEEQLMAENVDAAQGPQYQLEQEIEQQIKKTHAMENDLQDMHQRIEASEKYLKRLRNAKSFDRCSVKQPLQVRMQNKKRASFCQLFDEEEQDPEDKQSNQISNFKKQIGGFMRRQKSEDQLNVRCLLRDFRNIISRDKMISNYELLEIQSLIQGLLNGLNRVSFYSVILRTINTQIIEAFIDLQLQDLHQIKQMKKIIEKFEQNKRDLNRKIQLAKKKTQQQAQSNSQQVDSGNQQDQGNDQSNYSLQKDEISILLWIFRQISENLTRFGRTIHYIEQMHKGYKKYWTKIKFKNDFSKRKIDGKNFDSEISSAKHSSNKKDSSDGHMNNQLQMPQQNYKLDPQIKNILKDERYEFRRDSINSDTSDIHIQERSDTDSLRGANSLSEGVRRTRDLSISTQQSQRVDEQIDQQFVNLHEIFINYPMEEKLLIVLSHHFDVAWKFKQEFDNRRQKDKAVTKCRMCYRMTYSDKMDDHNKHCQLKRVQAKSQHSLNGEFHQLSSQALELKVKLDREFFSAKHGAHHTLSNNNKTEVMTPKYTVKSIFKYMEENDYYQKNKQQQQQQSKSNKNQQLHQSAQFNLYNNKSQINNNNNNQENQVAGPNQIQAHKQLQQQQIIINQFKRSQTEQAKNNKDRIQKVPYLNFTNLQSQQQLTNNISDQIVEVPQQTIVDRTSLQITQQQIQEQNLENNFEVHAKDGLKEFHNSMSINKQEMMDKQRYHELRSKNDRKNYQIQHRDVKSIMQSQLTFDRNQKLRHNKQRRHLVYEIFMKKNLVKLKMHTPQQIPKQCDTSQNQKKQQRRQPQNRYSSKKRLNTNIFSKSARIDPNRVNNKDKQQFQQDFVKSKMINQIMDDDFDQINVQKISEIRRKSQLINKNDINIDGKEKSNNINSSDQQHVVSNYGLNEEMYVPKRRVSQNFTNQEVSDIASPELQQKMINIKRQLGIIDIMKVLAKNCQDICLINHSYKQQSNILRDHQQDIKKFLSSRETIQMSDQVFNYLQRFNLTIEQKIAALQQMQDVEQEYNKTLPLSEIEVIKHDLKQYEQDFIRFKHIAISTTILQQNITQNNRNLQEQISSRSNREQSLSHMDNRSISNNTSMYRGGQYKERSMAVNYESQKSPLPAGSLQMSQYSMMSSEQDSLSNMNASSNYEQRAAERAKGISNEKMKRRKKRSPYQNKLVDEDEPDEQDVKVQNRQQVQQDTSNRDFQRQLITLDEKETSRFNQLFSFKQQESSINIKNSKDFELKDVKINQFQQKNSDHDNNNPSVANNSNEQSSLKAMHSNEIIQEMFRENQKEERRGGEQEESVQYSSIQKQSTTLLFSEQASQDLSASQFLTCSNGDLLNSLESTKKQSCEDVTNTAQQANSSKLQVQIDQAEQACLAGNNEAIFVKQNIMNNKQPVLQHQSNKQYEKSQFKKHKKSKQNKQSGTIVAEEDHSSDAHSSQSKNTSQVKQQSAHIVKKMGFKSQGQQQTKLIQFSRDEREASEREDQLDLVPSIDQIDDFEPLSQKFSLISMPLDRSQTLKELTARGTNQLPEVQHRRKMSEFQMPQFFHNKEDGSLIQLQQNSQPAMRVNHTQFSCECEVEVSDNDSGDFTEDQQEFNVQKQLPATNSLIIPSMFSSPYQDPKKTTTMISIGAINDQSSHLQFNNRSRMQESSHVINGQNGNMLETNLKLQPRNFQNKLGVARMQTYTSLQPNRRGAQTVQKDR